VARARGMAQGRVGGRPWIGEGRPKVGDDGRLGMTCGWGPLVGEREGEGKEWRWDAWSTGPSEMLAGGLFGRRAKR
jgi:hypothetical protein